MAETDLELMRARALARQRRSLALQQGPTIAAADAMNAQRIEPQLSSGQRNAVSSMALANPNPPSAGTVQFQGPSAMRATQPQQPAQSTASPQGFMGAVGDVARAGVAGVGRGVMGIIGLPGTVDDLIRSGLERTGIMPTADDLIAQGVPPDVAAQASQGSPLSGQALTGYANTVTGGATDYRGQTTAGQYAGTIGEFLPGGMAAKAPMMLGVVPGAASELAGQMVPDDAPAWAEPTARLAGALVAPSVATALTSPGSVSRALWGTGNPTAERQAATTVLENAGVRLTAGQRIGNDVTFRRELMTGPGKQVLDQQTEAFTRAILGTMGEQASRATPEVLNNARQRIGSVFNSVQHGIDITPSPAMVSQAQQVATDYADSVAAQVPAIRRVAEEIVSANPATGIPASEVQRWRTVLGGLTNGQDAATRDAASSLQDILDDGLSQALTTAGRQSDIARLEEARGQWRNYLAIVKAASGAGSETAQGILSPSAIRSAVATQGRTAYAIGTRGDIADLARAGEILIKRPATSGTFENFRASGGPAAALAGLGASVGASMDLPAMVTMGGTAAAMMAPAAYRRIGMTQPVQNALINTAGPRLVPQNYGNALSGLLAQ